MNDTTSLARMTSLGRMTLVYNRHGVVVAQVMVRRGRRMGAVGTADGLTGPWVTEEHDRAVAAWGQALARLAADHPDTAGRDVSCGGGLGTMSVNPVPLALLDAALPGLFAILARYAASPFANGELEETTE